MSAIKNAQRAAIKSGSIYIPKSARSKIKVIVKDGKPTLTKA